MLICYLILAIDKLSKNFLKDISNILIKHVEKLFSGKVRDELSRISNSANSCLLSFGFSSKNSFEISTAVNDYNKLLLK